MKDSLLHCMTLALLSAVPLLAAETPTARGLKGGAKPQKITIDAREADQLYLKATGYSWGQAVWGEPVLVDKNGVSVKLSSLKPTRVAVGWGRFTVDKGHDGTPLSVGGRVFAHGLFAHADSMVVYPLGRQYVRFESWVGINHTAGGRGLVDFEASTRLPEKPAWVRSTARGVLASEEQAAVKPLLKKIDAPLLYTKRHSYRGIHIYDAFYKWPGGGGGGIYIVENTSDPVVKWRERAIIDGATEVTLGSGLYTHPDLSWDGKKILFCYKGEARGDTCIYEIGIDGKGLRKVSDPSRVEVNYRGGGNRFGMHDLSPCYLPDGRIVFLSTRAAGLVPCNDSGVTILHVMNADGSDIHPISVNSENEFDPVVMPDGRIMFGRWEYIDKNALTVQSLWSVWPDGSNETAVYANNMTLPEAILDVRPVPGTDLLAGTFTKHNYHPRGSIAYIDPMVGKNDPKAIFNFSNPKDPTHDKGHSSDPLPLDRDSLLCSGRPQGAKRNAIELMDRSGQRFTLLEDPHICLHDPMLVKPRKKPNVLPTLADRTKKTGTFFVQNVYEGLEGIRQGEAKWLRIVEETSRVSCSPRSPTPYNQTFLVSGALAFAAKIYHGIVPINENGSIYFEAPSGRLLSFHVLDHEKRLIRSMRTFIQAAPGTTRSCIGCHEKKTNVPRSTAIRVSINHAPHKPRPESWGSGYMNYPTMVQPVWDRHCIRCHGGEKGFAARLDLTGGWTTNFNNSYENLIDRKETQLVAHYIAGIDCMNGTAWYSNQLMPPRSHGSAVAPLARVIASGHGKRIPNMTRTEKDLVMAWIDSNGLYYGNYNYTEHGYTSHSIRQAYGKLRGVMKEAGCLKCHDNRIPRDWINLQKPEFSRILRAPLAKGGKGYGQAICRDHKVDPRRSRIRILKRGRYEHSLRPLSSYPRVPMPAIQPGGKPKPVFADTTNRHYQAMLAIITDCRKATLERPRIDMPGAVAIPGRDRMLVQPPLPTVAPPLRVVSMHGKGICIAWPRTAANIGLRAELHRGSTQDFALSGETVLGSTFIDHFIDEDPGPGQRFYALILKAGGRASKPSRIEAK